MRVFDVYYFNIADRVRFEDAAAYLANMLTETGLSAPHIAFSAESFSRGFLSRAEKLMPELKKYACTKLYEYSGKPFYWGLTSASRDPARCLAGEIYAPPEEKDAILRLFAAIPGRLPVSECALVFGGIRWYAESTDEVLPDYTREDCCSDPLRAACWMYCNSVQLLRSGGEDGDGRRAVTAAVLVESTGSPVPRDTAEIPEKLRAYLGEPYHRLRTCLLPREKAAEIIALQKQHESGIRDFFRSNMPMPLYDETKKNDPFPLTDAAWKAQAEQAFRGTGFAKKKNGSRSGVCYQCTDSRGILYQARLIRYSGFHSVTMYINVFLHSCSFLMFSMPGDFTAADFNREPELIRRFAECIVKLRDAYGSKLAADFGEVPEWYMQGNDLWQSAR